MRGAVVRVEKRLDGSMAARYAERYLTIEICNVAEKRKPQPPTKTASTRRAGQRASDWNKNFDLKKGPKVWQVAKASGYPRSVDQ
jgi:hypothetical protein